MKVGKRSDIDRRLSTLTDISAILRVMRTLSIMETGKLSRFLVSQSQVVSSIEAAASDFLYYFPQEVPRPEETVPILLMIGSERGFCGEFNEQLVKAKAEHLSCSAAEPILIAVGARLCGKLRTGTAFKAVAGACTAEEVPMVINRVVDELNNFPRNERGGNPCLTILCHMIEDESVICRTLKPFPPDLMPCCQYPRPPIMNIAPSVIYSGLAEHYLFAALHDMFYQSLMVENRQRQRHIEGATRRLDQKTSDLHLRRNALRQEEIIDEIETLMLNRDNEF